MLRRMAPDDPQRQDALRALQRLKQEGDALGGPLARWLSAPAVGSSDPIEIRGTRIGRALSVATAIGLCLYLLWTYSR
jgi:hypothetical protein